MTETVAMTEWLPEHEVTYKSADIIETGPNAGQIWESETTETIEGEFQTTCEGIGTSTTLNRDLTYLVKTQYLGKNDKVFEQQGVFTWNEAGNTIHLLLVLEAVSGEQE